MSLGCLYLEGLLHGGAYFRKFTGFSELENKSSWWSGWDLTLVIASLALCLAMLPHIEVHKYFLISICTYYSLRSVGMPSIRTVAIINPHTEQTLQLQSLSGSTVHFHASFFQSKVSGDADTKFFYLGPKQQEKCASRHITK